MEPYRCNCCGKQTLTDKVDIGFTFKIPVMVGGEDNWDQADAFLLEINVKKGEADYEICIDCLSRALEEAQGSLIFGKKQRKVN